MKGYMIFENGFYFEGKLKETKSNVIGKVATGEAGRLFINTDKGLEDVDAFIEFEAEKVNVISKLINSKGLFGKIVVDQLDMDYHVYDLKTAYLY